LAEIKLSIFCVPVIRNILPLRKNT